MKSYIKKRVFGMNKGLHKNLLSYFLLFSIITLIITGILSYIQYGRLSNTYFNLIQSYQTIRAANQAIISIDEASLNVNSFLDTHNAALLSKIPELIISAEVNFEALKQLVADNKLQTDLGIEATSLLQDKILFLTKLIKQHTLEQANQPLLRSDNNSLDLTNRINSLIVGIKQEEIRQLNASATDLMKYKAELNPIIRWLGILSGLLFISFLYLLNSYLKSNTR
jgi:CHASE3 domain sensor protein